MQSFDSPTNSAEPIPKNAQSKPNAFAKRSDYFSVQRPQSHTDNIRKTEWLPSEETKQKIDYFRISEDSNPEAKPQHPVSPLLQVIPSKANDTQSSSSVVITLNFSRRNINRLPKTIAAHVQTLVTLDISHNQLTEISAEFLMLTKLKVLKISHNYIRSIPKEVFSDLSLEQLQISHNYLTLIPSSIELSKNTLITLNLSHNHIEEIPQELTRLTKLKSLWLNNNNFTALPATFDSLESLKDFALDWFKYTNPPHAVFQTRKNKKTLNKLFTLCQTLRESHCFSVNFEEFVYSISENKDVSVFNVKDSHNRNLLHIAVLEEEVGIIQYVLREKESLTNELDQEQQTALSLAIREEKYLIARTLLFYGADPKIGGGAFGSCLHMAMTKVQLNLVKELLKNGADPNARDSAGNTPFHLLSLIFSKDIEISAAIAEVLINSGCDANSKNNELWSPIHLMIKRGQIEGIFWIINFNKSCTDANKTIDMNATGGPDEWTPLHLAANFGYIEIFNILANNNADVSEKTKSGRSLRAVCHNNLLMTKLVRKTESDWTKTQLVRKFEMASKQIEPSLNTNLHKFNKLRHKSPLKNMTMIQQKNEQRTDRHAFTDIYTNTERLDSIQFEKSKISNIALQMRRKTEMGVSNVVNRYTVGTESRVSKQCRADDEIPAEGFSPLQNNEDSTAEGNSGFDIDERVKRTLKTSESCRILPKSPNDIQKIKITQNYRNKISRRSGSYHISELVSPSGEPYFQLVDGLAATKQQMAGKGSIPHDFYGYIRKFESYADEIKKFQNCLLDPELPLSEKLKFITYLKAVHFKLNQQIHSYSSEQFPLELFTINECIDDELRKRSFSTESVKRLKLSHDLVPKILIYVLGVCNSSANRSKYGAVFRAEVCRALGDIQYVNAKRPLELIAKTESENYYIKNEAGLAFLKLEAPPLVLGKQFTFQNENMTDSDRSEQLNDIEDEKTVAKTLEANRTEHLTPKMINFSKLGNKSKTKVTELARRSTPQKEIGTYLKQKYIREETIRPDLNSFEFKDQPKLHHGDNGEDEDIEFGPLHQMPTERMIVKKRFKKPNFPVTNLQEGLPNI